MFQYKNIIENKYDDNTILNLIKKKEFKRLKKTNKINKKNLFVYLIFILSYLFYYFSLESCIYGEGACSTHFIWIKTKVIEEILSSIFLAIMIELIVLKIIPKYHLIHIVIVFFFLIIIVMEWILLIMDFLISFFIVL